ncbi:hypothetical protein BV22DRAFT_1036718 [Leucogyrophana mollusca]|uniref:Uncharacterized protein n=1 Tax=Leucogyrophana mollusca TaxID=85980 RepID=A0ACB8BBD0_9AGAM|nr:hypothetical protein BV22DRAFT_1036718 [Leucogyrophana mollusca]
MSLPSTPLCVGDVQHVARVSIKLDGTYTIGDSAMRTFTPKETPVDLSPSQRVMTGAKVTVHVSYIQGKLYLEEEDPHPGRRYKFDRGDAIGMAFEDEFTATNPSATWTNVVTRKFGDITVLYSGEVDGVKAPIGNHSAEDLMDRRVELKTTGLTRRNNLPWRKWYMQSYLLGIPTVFIGYRDHADVVRETEEVHLADMPIRENQESRIAREGYGALVSLKKTFASLSEGEVGSDDAIWKVTIQGGALRGVKRLNENQAQKVKMRRADPEHPVDRLGIVPRRIIEVLKVG